jgi:hypothetical protein
MGKERSELEDDYCVENEAIDLKRGHHVPDAFACILQFHKRSNDYSYRLEDAGAIPNPDEYT